MTAGWNRPAPRQIPNAIFRPHHWSYAQAKAALDAAGSLVSTDVAERRNLILVNPAAENTRAAARTMMAAYQMVMPGEQTRAHRHTPSALRLILDAEPEAYTIVNGEKIPMLAGDVVLTPNWSWHSHVNEGQQRAYWLDFLDVPLVQLLNLQSREDRVDDFRQSRYCLRVHRCDLHGAIPSADCVLQEAVLALKASKSNWEIPHLKLWRCS